MKKTKFLLASILVAQSILSIAQVDPACSGYSENSLHFDGSNDYVNFGDVNDLGTSDFTVEAWVNLDGNGSLGSMIMCKGMTALGTPQNAGYQLRVHYGATDEVVFSIGDASGATSSVTTTISGFNGQWHHLVGVREGTQIRLYVDCNLEGTTNTGTVYNVNTDRSLALGAMIKTSFNQNYFTDGRIDEVKIWDVARTDHEVCDSPDSYMCSVPDELIAYYHLNENTANGSNSGLTTVTDFAGSNNGTATNFSMSGSTSNWSTGYDFLDADPGTLDPSIYVSSETLFANVTTYSSYQWNDCNESNSPITGETGTSYAPMFDGSYSLTVQDGCCEATSCCLQIDVKADYLDVPENRLEVSFEEFMAESLIYPNPVNDIVNLKIDYNSDLACRVVVYDMNGKEHKTFDVLKNGLNTFNLSSLQQGNYLLVVQSGDLYKSYKFLKN